jgi:hypothetical protein
MINPNAAASAACNGWIVVARIGLLSGEGYLESSPFAVAARDEGGAVEVIRRAFPLKHDVEITAVDTLSAQEVAILGLRQGEFRARWKRVAQPASVKSDLAED